MKSFLIIAFVIFLFIAKSESSGFSKYFTDGALRFDYFHSGSDTFESVKAKCFSRELYFSGPLTTLTDPFDYGKYKFEVYKDVTGEMIFSRGYSTLFSEWQQTDEAKNKIKSFEETLLMPYPLLKIRIRIFSRDRDNHFNLIFTCSFDPQKDSFKNNSFKKYNFINISFNNQGEILQTGKYHETLDIALIPDGYRVSDSQKLTEDSRRLENYLYNCRPYDKNKNKISLWLIKAYSQDSGTTVPSENIVKNTLVKTSFSTFGVERYLMSEDYHHIRDIAANVPYDQIYIIVNSSIYGGGSIYNFYSVCVSNNSFTEYIFTHEFGHGFAGLADEYYDSEVATTGMYNLKVEPWEPNLTTLNNFSQKWEDLVNPETPIPTPDIIKYNDTVGAFEGGGYLSRGVFRPFRDCTMKSTRVNYFCPVCSRAIVRMLGFYTNW